MRVKGFILFNFIIGVFLLYFLACTGVAGEEAQSGDKVLGVIIMANGNSIKLRGYCIYVKKGKEIRKELQKDNAWGWNFRGDYIKEVKIQKVSGDASYRLYIMEGENSASGQPVFESDLISSTEAIIYKRNK